MKAWDIAVKNLKLIFRNKAIIPVLILIPVFYYSIMGFTFGASGGIDISQYTVGYINADVESTVEPISPYQSLDFIIETITNASANEQTGLFQLSNLTVMNSSGNFDRKKSIEHANRALIEEGIVAYAMIEENFQLGINEAIRQRVGILDNDSSSNPSYDIRLKGAFIYDLLQQMNYEVVNLSSSAFSIALTDFDHYAFDYLLVIESGYEAQIESGDPPTPQITVNYHSYSDTQKVEYFQSLLNATLSPIITSAMGQLVSITSVQKSTTGQPIIPSYTLFFLASTSPTTISIINQTFSAILDSILNYNPQAVQLNASFQYTEGKAINNLTQYSAGYLMYGALNIMSFAMILITTEIKEGLFKRLLSSRMKISDLLRGNIIANTIITFIQIVIGFGVLILWGMRPYYFNLATLILGMCINTIAISFFLNSLALLLVPIFRSPDAAAGGVWFLLIPLMTFSGVFFPIEFLAPSFAAVVRWIPTRMTVLAYQAIMINGLALTNSKFWLNVVLQLAISAVLYLIGLYTFHRFTRSEKVKMTRSSKKKKENKPDLDISEQFQI